MLDLGPPRKLFLGERDPPTMPCPRGGGLVRPVSWPLFALGTARSQSLCGSKAGATLCLALISIGRGVKPRASQRCRNTLPSDARFGAPRKLFLGERDPPTMPRPRGEVSQRSHGPKLDYNVRLLYIMQE